MVKIKSLLNIEEIVLKERLMNNIQKSSDLTGEIYQGAIVLPRCSICNQVPVEGLRDVIKVGKAWICKKCEQEIVNLEVGSPKYGLILDKIKRVWR